MALCCTRLRYSSNAKRLPMRTPMADVYKRQVAESDDPYGDHETNPDAKVLKHLQEAIILDGNVPGIKEAVMKYGAVQSSFFSPNLE